jgi:hypothetical protein
MSPEESVMMKTWFSSRTSVHPSCIDYVGSNRYPTNIGFWYEALVSFGMWEVDVAPFGGGMVMWIELLDLAVVTWRQTDMVKALADSRNKKTLAMSLN